MSGSGSGGRKTTLTDYADGKGPETFDHAPRVMLTAYTTAVKVPTDRSKVAGWTGIDAERGRCFISVRKRSNHYFDRYEGYAISEPILQRIERENVEYVVIWEQKYGRSYVWSLDKFLDGQRVDPAISNGRNQVAQRLVDAQGIWEQESRPIIDNR